MSTRCAFMSSRPSSNTANSPQGPAPMMSTSVLIGSVMRYSPQASFTGPHTYAARGSGRRVDVAGTVLQEKREIPHNRVHSMHLSGLGARPVFGVTKQKESKWQSSQNKFA